MSRRDNRTHLGYMAFVLGWLGYASVVSASPLQLESTPLFLVFKVESNLVFMIDDSGSMNWEVITGDFTQDGRYTNIQRDGSSSGVGQVKHRDNNDDRTPDCGFGTPPSPCSNLPLQCLDPACPFKCPDPWQSFYGYAYGVEFPSNGDQSPLVSVGNPLIPVNTTPALQKLNCNTADDEEWRFRNHDFNPLYFNPKQTYLPWAGVDAAGNKFQNMPIAKAKDNPYDADPNARKIDLTRNNSQGDPNVVSYRNDPTQQIPDGFRYYTWTDANRNGLFDDGEETVHFIKDDPPDVQQNFANWFSYYRKREYVVKAVYGDIIANMSNARVGLVTLHNNMVPTDPEASPRTFFNKLNPRVTSIDTPLKSIGFDQNLPPGQANSDPAQGTRRVLLDALYSFHVEGGAGTSLRTTLERIGDYLTKAPDRTLFSNDDAYLTAEKGGACQQSFTILMTDGLESGGSPKVGNADQKGKTDPPAPHIPGFNGGPYADDASNTLADVAMYYYQRDLRPLDDNVPTNQFDQARHQHMVTYTVTFDGFNGSLSSNPLPTQDGTTFWPDPYCRICVRTPQFKIDDLRHAAINGRGLFLQANDAASLQRALSEALTNIAQRTSSAASVAVNTGTRSASSRLYQARFDSGNWTGQLLSIKIDPTTGNPSQDPRDIIDSGALLDQRLRTPRDVDNRLILTYKPSTASGVLFKELSELDTEQQSAFNLDSNGRVDNILGQARVDYLRGSNADEGQGYGFRVRTHRLGDLINSDPIFVGPPDLPDNVDSNFDDPTQPNLYVKFRDETFRNRMKMILVGGNDGLLHIFNADDPLRPTPGATSRPGDEILAYMPNSVLKKTVDLLSPTYKHRYYVDGSAAAGDVFLSRDSNWHTIAVGGLGGGGQGYFALDITDPTTFNEAQAPKNVLWEFTDADDPDLGVALSKPSLVRMRARDGNDRERWAVVFGNGHNNSCPKAPFCTEADAHVSTTGHAVLFIVFLDGPSGAGGTWRLGTDYIKIDTGIGDPGTPNGLATPAPIDTQGKLTAEYIIAGDLRGNLWRFDVTSTNPADWKPNLLFTATSRDANNTPQPITSRPEVGRDLDNPDGFIVYFGTGKYLELADNSLRGATTQTFYGIRDKDPRIANSSLLVPLVSATDLLPQIFIETPRPLTVTDASSQTRNVRVTDNKPCDAQHPGGFLLDLGPGEKQVSDSVLRNGRIIFSTLLPNDQPCNFGGTSSLIALNAQCGGRPSEPFFDINKDKLFNNQDMVMVNGKPTPFNVLETSVGIVKTPTLQTSGATDTFYISGTTGNAEAEEVHPGYPPTGRQAWRKITQ